MVLGTLSFEPIRLVRFVGYACFPCCGGRRCSACGCGVAAVVSVVRGGEDSYLPLSGRIPTLVEHQISEAELLQNLSSNQTHKQNVSGTDPFSREREAYTAAISLLRQTMVRASTCLVTCVYLLDPRVGDASWPGARALRHPHQGRSSSETRALRFPRLMRAGNQQQQQRPRPRRGAAVELSSGTELLPARVWSCRRKRESTMGCCEEGMHRQESWRRQASLFVVAAASRSPAASSRAYTGNIRQTSCVPRYSSSSSRETSPPSWWRRPSAELLRDARRCGPCAATPQRRERVRRRCHARVGASMTIGEGDDGEFSSAALPIPPRITGSNGGRAQQQQQHPGPEGGPDEPYARPEVPRWRHKAVIIPG